jgi:hypothetical protein
MSDSSAFIPATRRPRRYHDEENYPLVVLPHAVRLDSATRWILTRSGLQSGPMLVVADANGAIPEFESLASARSYASRLLPPPDPISADFELMVAGTVEAEVDLDSIIQWTGAPAARAVGPIELAEAWELLAAADALIELPPWNATGAMAIHERIGGRDADRAAEELLVSGMKLSGAVQEIRRKNPDARGVPWPPELTKPTTPDFTLWTAADDELVARALRAGIAEFGVHLSVEAAMRDVTQTWADRLT